MIRPRRKPEKGRCPADAGAATVEFVFVGVLVLVPLLYLVLAVFEVQRNAFAVTEAARAAGRAYATADTPATASARAAYAVQLALADQGLDGGAELHWGTPGNGCAGPPLRVPATGRLKVDSTVSPPLGAGSEFEVCVVRSYRVPGVPSMLDAGRNTVAARYVVHVGRLKGLS